MDGFAARIIHDTLETASIEDVAAAARDALAPVLARSALPVGARVAVTAGSRGVARIPEILRGACDAVRAAGGEPFLVAAMGSHGGGTGPGQRHMLEHLGVTEASVGAPLQCEMDVVEVGRTALGVPVYADAIAAKADAIVVCGRVKPHTDFSGTIESGMLKMTAIGLGKAAGARVYHGAFARYGYERVIREVAAEMFRALPIVAGLAVVEDHRGGTSVIEAFTPDGIVAGEERLLKLARSLMGRLPFAELDLLIVDEMGKNFSGTGMDTNVTGRAIDGRTQKTPTPLVRQLYVRDLHPKSEGNATGIGLADFCTRRLADAIDWQPTYLNVLTAAQPAGARLPIVVDTDRDAVVNALNAVGIVDPAEAKVARISDTLHATTIVASEAALATLEQRERFIVEGPSDALQLHGDELTAFPRAYANA